MSHRFHLVIFFASVAIAVTLRSIMMLFCTDSASGFIIPEYKATAILIIAILCILAGGIFLSALITRPKKTRTAYTGGIFYSVSCFLLAFSIIYETFFSNVLFGTHPIQKYLQYFFTFASAAFLVYIAVRKINGEKYNPYFSIAPVLFWLMRLIIIFGGFSTISTISDTVIETFGLCLTLVTFLYFSKTESGHLSKKKKTIAFAVALLNSYVCFLASLPRLLCELIAFSQPIHLNEVPILTGFAVALFSASFAYRMLRVSMAEE